MATWQDILSRIFVEASDGSDAGVVVVKKSNDGISSDREMGATAARVSDTWTEAEGITSVVITAVAVAAGQAVTVCFDAPDDATAVNWLAGNTTEGEPTMRKVVTTDAPREFFFTNPLRRIDAMDLGALVVTNTFIETN